MQNVVLSNGVEIPTVGFGVYQMTSEEVRRCLPQAFELGYRHIDTANAYFNEVAVGEAVRASGIDRSELFITSKLFPQSYAYEQCAKDIDATLTRMGLDYLDLLLFHQPYGEYVDGWRAMEEALAAGKVRAIGISNFPLHKIEQILEVATVKPHVLQVELHPHWNQHELKGQLAEHGIAFESYYPLGHGDAKLLGEPLFAELAEKHGKTAAQVILRWNVQEGNIVFPKTLNPEHMAANIDLFDFELSDDDMARISALEQVPYYVVPEEAPDFVKPLYDYDGNQA